MSETSVFTILLENILYILNQSHSRRMIFHIIVFLELRNPVVPRQENKSEVEFVDSTGKI